MLRLPRSGLRVGGGPSSLRDLGKMEGAWMENDAILWQLLKTMLKNVRQ